MISTVNTQLEVVSLVTEHRWLGANLASTGDLDLLCTRIYVFWKFVGT